MQACRNVLENYELLHMVVTHVTHVLLLEPCHVTRLFYVACCRQNLHSPSAHVYLRLE